MLKDIIKERLGSPYLDFILEHQSENDKQELEREYELKGFTEMNKKFV